MFLLADLASLFPNLLSEGYRRTSSPTINYNCIAWAAGDDTRRWDVVRGLGAHWPDAVQRRWTRRNLIAVFASEGYEKCADGDLEQGFEKIAIYCRNGEPKHAARQLDDGGWTSKLGDLDDITHTLNGLAGDRYGNPDVFMRRHVQLV